MQAKFKAPLRLLVILSAFGVTIFSMVSPVHAGHREFEPSQKDEVEPPAMKYNGSTPIDLHHGLLFNNGTQGTANTDYEEWAKAPVLVKGVSEKVYPFSQKASLVKNVKEQIYFGDSAMFNWSHVTEISKPEGQEHAKNAIASLTPVLDRLKDATKKADSSDSGHWEVAQADLRRALIDWRSAYTQLHKNVAH